MNDRIVVRLFAGARELAGSDCIEIDIVFPATVSQLKQAITFQFEPLRSLVQYGRIALNNEFAADNTIIPNAPTHMVIALIPPVSGG